jgi:uncharacterized membrane protein YphA (DoxX/SURF4 family)
MNAKTTNILGYVLAVLIILMGVPKLIGAEGSIESFKAWGLDDPMRMIIGVSEVLLGVLMFVKSTKYLAALGVFCMMPAGAVIHIAAGEWPMLALPVVMGLLFLLYLTSSGVINFKGKEA